MDECRSTTTVDSSKELDAAAVPTVDNLKSTSANVVSDEEYKDVNEANDGIKELNGLKSDDLSKKIGDAESQLNDLSLNDKKESLSKRTDEDGSEDEYYDVTSDGSNVDSELSSHEEEHKSADEHDEAPNNDWEDDDQPLEQQQDNEEEDELNLDKSKDEREQGDGEVSSHSLY